MSERMRKPLTEKDLQILVKGKELKLKKDKAKALLKIIDNFIETESYSGRDVFGPDIDEPKMRIAKYLKGSRVKSNMTQVEVCEKLEIDQANLSAMENGRRPIPSRLVKEFSKLFNCSEKILLG